MNSHQDRPENLGGPINCALDEGFSAWLANAGGSVVATTYQAGKVALLGHDGKQPSILLRDFEKPMGFSVHGNNLALATRNSILQFANAPLLAPDCDETKRTRYSHLFLPRVAHFTGDLNVHDLAYGKDGLWMVNTRFGCLTSLSTDFSFVPRWQPPFVTETAPEDRCHLNGLAMRNGDPAFVTALGTTDTAGGWRSGKATGGVILDVATKEIVLRGLSMPHSPRWYDGALWVLNSGTGELLCVNTKESRATVVCKLPGFLRGLCFVGPWALIGLCRIREKHIFGGLPIAAQHDQLLCGVAAVDLRTAKVAGIFRFTEGCQELYDVSFLPGVSRGNILGPEKLAAQQAFTAPEFSYWLRPSNVIPDPPQA